MDSMWETAFIKNMIESFQKKKKLKIIKYFLQRDMAGWLAWWAGAMYGDGAPVSLGRGVSSASVAAG